MNWKLFILILEIKTMLFCQPLRINNQICENYPQNDYCNCIDWLPDCVMDGETIKWCTDSVIETLTEEHGGDYEEVLGR